MTTFIPGQRVLLTIRDLDRPSEDLRYLRRQGKYADTKYGPTLDGRTLIVAGTINDRYVQLQDPDRPGLMAYFADPTEVEPT